MIEESEEKKETKHRIALLVELILFPRIRAFNKSNDINKEENKKQAIKFFIKEYAQKEKELSEEEITKIVHSVLDRTMNNLKNKGR